MTFIVTHDGKPVSPEQPDENAAYSWLQKHQGMSTGWALRHEGYAIVDTTADSTSPERATPRAIFTRLKSGESVRVVDPLTRAVGNVTDVVRIPNDRGNATYVITTPAFKIDCSPNTKIDIAAQAPESE